MNVDSGRHRSLPCLYWVLGRDGLGERIGSEEGPFLIHSLPGIQSAMYALAATLNANASICSSHTWLSVFMVMSVCFLTHILPVSSPIRSDSSSLSISFLSLSPPPLFYPYLYLVLSCPVLSVIPTSSLWLAQICISSPPRDSYRQLHCSHAVFICHPCLYLYNYNQALNPGYWGPIF